MSDDKNKTNLPLLLPISPLHLSIFRKNLKDDTIFTPEHASRKQVDLLAVVLFNISHVISSVDADE